MSVKYVVKIPFTVDRESRGVLPDWWVIKRYDEFLNGTYKSIKNQTFKNFELWLEFGEWKRSLTDAMKWPSDIKTTYDFYGDCVKTCDKDFLSVTRIDSDDLMHKDAMGEINKRVEKMLDSDFKSIYLIFKNNLCWNRNKGNEFLSYHRRKRPPFYTHVYSKFVLRRPAIFTRMNRLPHGQADIMADIKIKLSDYKICVVKHAHNDSDVKNDREPVVMSKDRWEENLKKGRVITKDKDKMYKILKDFGVSKNKL